LYDVVAVVALYSRFSFHIAVCGSLYAVAGLPSSLVAGWLFGYRPVLRWIFFAFSFWLFTRFARLTLYAAHTVSILLG